MAPQVAKFSGGAGHQIGVPVARCVVASLNWLSDGPVSSDKVHPGLGDVFLEISGCRVEMESERILPQIRLVIRLKKTGLELRTTKHIRFT